MFSEDDVIKKWSQSALLAFIFFLPLFEAPKNIFGTFFLVLTACRFLANGKRFRLSVGYSYWIVTVIILILIPFLAGADSPVLSASERFRNSLNWVVMPLVALVFIASKPDSKIILNVNI